MGTGGINGGNEAEGRNGDRDGDRTEMGGVTPRLTPALVSGPFRAVLRDDVPPGGPAGGDAALHRPPCPSLLPVSPRVTLGGGGRCFHRGQFHGGGGGGGWGAGSDPAALPAEKQRRRGRPGMRSVGRSTTKVPLWGWGPQAGRRGTETPPKKGSVGFWGLLALSWLMSPVPCACSGAPAPGQNQQLDRAALQDHP